MGTIIMMKVIYFSVKYIFQYDNFITAHLWPFFGREWVPCALVLLDQLRSCCSLLFFTTLMSGISVGKNFCGWRLSTKSSHFSRIFFREFKGKLFFAELCFCGYFLNSFFTSTYKRECWFPNKFLRREFGLTINASFTKIKKTLTKLLLDHFFEKLIFANLSSDSWKISSLDDFFH